MELSQHCFSGSCLEQGNRDLIRDACTFTGSPKAVEAFRDIHRSGLAHHCLLASIVLQLGHLYFVGPQLSDGPLVDFKSFIADLRQCDLSDDHFFEILHVSRSQMAYSYWLMSDTREALPDEVMPAGDLPPGRIFDFGTNRGYDSSFYVALNRSVVAVDAHPHTERLFIKKLDMARKRKNVVVLNRALVAAGGPRSVTFFVCEEDTRSTMDSSLGYDREWCKNAEKADVLATTCADLLQEYGPAIFVKIDVEGVDKECLESMLRSPMRNQFPRYLSVEIAFGHSFSSGREGTTFNNILLDLLIEAGYTHFKLSRQALFNPPFWGGQLAGSGPFGEAASDWLTGAAWRSAADVASDFSRIKQMRIDGELIAEWFDLHATKYDATRDSRQQKELGICMMGFLRGLCSREDGIDQLHEHVLSKFASFDVFLVVPLEDCQLATKLFKDDPRIGAVVVCMEGVGVPPDEFKWLQTGPMTDPDVCDARYCGYVWRDVARCSRVMQDHMEKVGVTYWRIARARVDLRFERFPDNPREAFKDEYTVWSYAIPDRQWIAMPDRFAIGPAAIMLHTYFGTYDWMINPQSYQYYHPQQFPVCMLRGHLEYIGANLQTDMRYRGKIWACPQHSAHRRAITGPEAVLESRMRLHNVAMRLRPDICINNMASKERCGETMGIACEQERRFHPERGYWLNDWEKFAFPGTQFIKFLQKTAGQIGSGQFESGIYHYDALLTARLAQFFFGEWGKLERPPRILDFGAGRGAMVEQLDRWYLPVVGIDGNNIIELTLRDRGLRGDLTSPYKLGRQEVGPARLHFGERNEENMQSGIWYRWSQNLLSSDWVLAFDVANWMPSQESEKQLFTHIWLHARIGVIMTWPNYGLNGRSRESILEKMKYLGFKVDPTASAELSRYGGVLCCPTHSDVLVFRRGTSTRPSCNITDVEGALDKCVVGQTYGCVDGGIWVHMNCAGHFTACINGITHESTCISDNFLYTECNWTINSDSKCQGRSSQAKIDDPPVARKTIRSDLLGYVFLEENDGYPVMMPVTKPSLNTPLRHQMFTRMFGMPLSFLYDLMDPLTSSRELVWSGDRSLTIAMIKAFKLSALHGDALVHQVQQWDLQWHLHYQALSPWAARLGRTWNVGVERFAIIISSLRAAAAHIQALTMSSCRKYPRIPSLSSAGRDWKNLKNLKLASPCAQVMLGAWDYLARRFVTTERRSVRFIVQPGDSGGHLRFRHRFHHKSLLGQYLYRVAFQAPGHDWTSE